MSVTDLLIRMKPKRRPLGSLDNMQTPLLGRGSAAISINRIQARRLIIAMTVFAITLLVVGKTFNSQVIWPEQISLSLIKNAFEGKKANTVPKGKSGEPTYRVELQLTDDPTKFIHKPNTLMDTCRIMPQCFAHSKAFGELKSCQDSIALTMKHYDSGLLIETVPGGEDEVVGFLSALPIRRQNNIFILIYNVCIDGGRRRKGLGKKLLTDFVEKYVNVTNWPRDRIYVALDVDLRTPVAVGALSLYIKLGFVRWMEPCKSIYENDVSRAIRPPHTQRPLENLAAIFSDPKGYAKTFYQQYDQASPENKDKGPHPTHFCMYKKLEESYDEIGKALVASIADLDKRFPNMVIPDDD